MSSSRLVVVEYPSVGVGKPGTVQFVSNGLGGHLGGYDGLVTDNDLTDDDRLSKAPRDDGPAPGVADGAASSGDSGREAQPRSAESAQRSAEHAERLEGHNRTTTDTEGTHGSHQATDSRDSEG